MRGTGVSSRMSLSVALQLLHKHSIRISYDSMTLEVIQALFSIYAVAVTNLISGGLSGLMGLGFNGSSELQVTPFWETLWLHNLLSEPLFSFYLEQYIDKPLMDAAPGGILTFGGTNSSLYQGSIEYTSLTFGAIYWQLNVKS
jgi:cathepsin D